MDLGQDRGEGQGVDRKLFIQSSSWGGKLEEASDCNPQLSNVVANMRRAGRNSSGLDLSVSLVSQTAALLSTSSIRAHNYV